MRDPHVESLQYDAEPIGQVSYKNPPSLEYENGLCTLTLADGILVVRPKSHCATVLQASVAIEPFLRAWELDADLRWGLGTIKFNYKDHSIVDRNPPPPGEPCPKTLHAVHGGFLVPAGSLSKRGDAKTARKLKKSQSLQPLVGAEQTWLEEAVKALIRKLGEHRPSKRTQLLSMRDLPSL